MFANKFLWPSRATEKQASPRAIMPIPADQRHPNALKPKKPRKPPGLAGLSLANLAPENSFVLSDTG